MANDTSMSRLSILFVVACIPVWLATFPCSSNFIKTLRESAMKLSLNASILIEDLLFEDSLFLLIFLLLILTTNKIYLLIYELSVI